MTTKAEQMERRIANAAKEMHRADARAERLRVQWEELCLKGFTEQSITYERLGELSKLSRARIDQVLRKVRKRLGLPVNSQS